MVVMTTVEVYPNQFADFENEYDINYEIMQIANRQVKENYGFHPFSFSYDYQIHELD